jgi:hypothetical protein
VSSENFRLDREIDAAKLLRTSLADLIADDESVAADLIEGQTNLNEAIQSATNLFCQDKCAVDAIEEHIKMMETRKARLKKRMEMTRVLVATALELAGKKSVETALGTATLKATARKLVIDTERESEIPVEYWKRGDPTLDKKKITEDLKNGKDIKGARLDNGGIAVQFSFR